MTIDRSNVPSLIHDSPILSELDTMADLLNQIEQRTADPETINYLLDLEAHLISLDLLLRLNWQQYSNRYERIASRHAG